MKNYSKIPAILLVAGITQLFCGCGSVENDAQQASPVSSGTAGTNAKLDGTNVSPPQGQFSGPANDAIRLVVAGRYDQAAVAYGKIADTDGHDSRTGGGLSPTFDTALQIYYLCAKAQAYMLAGKSAEAQSALSEAESVSDSNAGVHGDSFGEGVRVAIRSTMGFLAEKSGDLQQAKYIYEQSPTNYGNARLALFAVNENRPDDAKRLAAPGDLPTEQIVLGLVAAKEGNSLEAQEWFEKARKQRANPARNEFLPICWCEAPP
jgi:tetratricopeptide (TPR) repeat protein